MILANNLEPPAAFLLACSLKATVVLGIAWMLAGTLRRRSAAIRHSIWAVAIVGILVLPLLSLLMPAWHSTALGGTTAVWKMGHAADTSEGIGKIPTTVVDAVLGSQVTRRWAGVVLLVWGVGFCIFVARTVAGLVGLKRFALCAQGLDDKEIELLAAETRQRFGMRRDIRLLQSGHSLTMPVTWGALRPVILLPDGAGRWSVDRKRSVLSHEIAHIARMDWLFQMFAEVARAFYWFHPFAWIAAVRLRRESEQACDDCVLSAGIEAASYAKSLLDLAQTLENPSRKWSAALAIVRRTNLERRFRAMLNSRIDRRSLSRGGRLGLALVALVVLLPLAAVRLPAQNAGKFGGVISDPSGTPVANATIIMNNHKENGIQMTTSDAEGKYSFVGLPAGEYEVRVAKRGFAEFRATISALDSGHDSPHNDVTLQIGSVNEEINVYGNGGPEKGVKQGVEGGVSGGASGGVKGAVSGGAAGGVASGVQEKTIRLRIGGEVQEPKIVEKIQPVYPEKAKAAGIDGTVILHAVIGVNGRPLSLRVMNNQIDPDLARAAVEAVSKWRYQPTLLNGEPVEVDTTVKVNFTLRP